MGRAEYMRVEQSLMGGECNKSTESQTDSIEVDALSLKLTIHVERFLGWTGAELLYIGLALPALYVLKKISDKALDKFATWMVEKLLFFLRKQFGSRPKPSENLWAMRVTFFVSIADELPRSMCEIRMSEDLAEEILRDRLEALVRFLVSSAVDGKLAEHWILYWSSHQEAWLIEGTGYAFRPSDSAILEVDEKDEQE